MHTVQSGSEDPNCEESQLILRTLQTWVLRGMDATVDSKSKHQKLKDETWDHDVIEREANKHDALQLAASSSSTES